MNKQLEELNVNGLMASITLCTNQETTLHELYQNTFFIIDLMHSHFSADDIELIPYYLITIGGVKTESFYVKVDGIHHLGVVNFRLLPV